MEIKKLKSAFPGERFDKLVVISAFSEIVNGRKISKRLCRCDCGKEKVIVTTDLTKKNIRHSCGCLRKECNLVHGLTSRNSDGKLIVKIWYHMKDRCLNQNNVVFHRYGGRGITFCKEWEDCRVFYKWAMENGYNSELTIDRVNNDGNYDPSNCRWVTQHIQTRNTCRNKYVTTNGKTKVLNDWLNEADMTTAAFYRRLRKGMTEEQAILTPKAK